MTIVEIVQVLLMAGAVTFAFSLLAFWIWMLVDCLTKESKEGNDRLMWVLTIVFTKLIGAALYYFLRYRKRSPV